MSLVTSQEQLDAIIEEAIKERWVSFDTETFGDTMPWLSDKKKAQMIDELRAKMAGFSIAYADKCYYVPVAHIEGTNLDPAPAIKKLFSSTSRVWAHNWKYDARVVHNTLGEPLWPSKYGDTMVLAWLTGDGVPTLVGGELKFRHGLKDLVLHHFNHKMASFAETVGERVCTTPRVEDEIGQLEQMLALAYKDVGTQVDMFGYTTDSTALNKEIKGYIKQINQLKKQLKFRDKQSHEVHPSHMAQYAAEDAKWTLKLAQKLGPKLIKMGYLKQFDELEMPCVRIIREMQDVGVAIDVGFFERLSQEMGTESKRLEEKWSAITGSQITSARQAAKAVYEELGAWTITDSSRTVKGALSVNKKAIHAVLATAPQGSLARQLAETKLEHSKKYKIANTYTGALIRQMPYRVDGRLHAEINMTGTETGRWSTNNPNLQAMPKDMVRGGFLASPGCVLIDMDYVGLETVIAAHYSHDPNLLEVILKGKNLHDLNMELLKVDRATAKTVWFGYQYMCRPKKMAQSLNVPLIQRERGGRTFYDAPDHIWNIYENLNKAYERLVEWREEVKEQCRKDGFVSTVTGHRRYLPDINSTDTIHRFRVERQAVNAVVQGSGAGIIKAAMVQIWKSFKENPEWDAKMLLQVHDSLLIECREEHQESVIERAKTLMENTTRLDVPLSVSWRAGRTWG